MPPAPLCSYRHVPVSYTHLLVSATYHDGHTEVLGTSDADEVNLPMVVITNENAASAAELFAQAIKDYNKGRTVGTQTYGKGVMQTIYPLSDGGALSITVAKYNPCLLYTSRCV